MRERRSRGARPEGGGGARGALANGGRGGQPARIHAKPPPPASGRKEAVCRESAETTQMRRTHTIHRIGAQQRSTVWTTSNGHSQIFSLFVVAQLEAAYVMKNQAGKATALCFPRYLCTNDFHWAPLARGRPPPFPPSRSSYYCCCRSSSTYVQHTPFQVSESKSSSAGCRERQQPAGHQTHTHRASPVTAQLFPKTLFLLLTLPLVWSPVFPFAVPNPNPPPPPDIFPSVQSFSPR